MLNSAKFLISKICANAFLQSLTTVVLGIASAQIITIIATPLLGRLYGPDVFGHFTAFMVIVSILGVLFGGGYPNGIPSLTSESDAVIAVQICHKIAQQGSLIVFVAGVVFFSESHGYVVILIPLFTSLYGYNQPLEAWFTRCGEYRWLSGVRVGQAIVTSSVSIVLGTLGCEEVGLILGSLSGILYAFLCYYRRWKEEVRVFSSYKELWNKALQLCEYPKYCLTTSLVQLATVNAFPLALLRLYGSEVLGFFGMAMKVFGTFSSVCGTAVAQVFQPIASKRMKLDGQCRSLFLNSLLLMSLITVVLGVGSYFFLPTIVLAALGPKWEKSLPMFWWLAPQAGAVLIAYSVGSVKLLQGATHWYWRIFVVQAVLCVVGSYVGWIAADGVQGGVILGYSIGSMIGYIVNIFVSWQIASGRFGGKR